MSVTSTAPERKTAERRLGKRKGRLSPWLLLPLALVLIIAGVLLWQLRQSGTATTSTATATVTKGSLSVSVTGSGPAQAVQSRVMSFSVSGTVDAVLVKAGDVVKAGQPLARLDARALTLQVQQAEASQKAAQANLAAAQGKGATAQDIASAQASLTSAEASYQRTRIGSATPGDIASARAQLQSAQASLAQAQAAFDQAKQDEVTGLAQAESSLKDAQTQLSVLLAGPTAANLASSEASVASAQSNLDKLLHPATAADLASAQASVDQAKINLEKLTTPASVASLASAEASLASAQVQLAAAQLNLENATLTAPFDGIVASVGVVAGDAATAGTITVIDASHMYIDISLGESDVSQVKPGMAVELTFDAVAGLKITGKVDTVAPVATVTQNVVTYPVRVSFDPGTEPIKVGMTATGLIVTKQLDNVILVPSRVLQTRGGAQTVQVRPAVGQPAVPVSVVTGLSANGQTEIVSCVDTGDQCLREGDTLVIAATTSTTTQRSGLGGFGGGGPQGRMP